MSKKHRLKTVFVQSLKSLSRKSHSGRSLLTDFCSMLTLFITRSTGAFGACSAALAEGFISTATRRSSILAAAETIVASGTQPTPSWGS
ncbi:hypothetical protein [Escherichia coli]|uniref:hypothetical protein n=1 Tax=Escherichia coli TaxID=562 RepID=UPI00339BE780